MHVASVQERTLCGFHRLVFSYRLARIRLPRMQNAVVDHSGTRPIDCSERNAGSLGVQLSFRWKPCPDLVCPLRITRKTTRRSLIVPTVTSSFNWEEVGRRSCSVGDRTLVPSGVGGRRCARSEGEPRPRHIVSPPQQCGRCRRRCTRRSFEGNGFDVFTMSIQGMCPLSPKMSLHMVVPTVGVVRLLRRVRCDFCVFLAT